ncbi:ureidoglycolate lyase [Sulfobacillus thermosulfidooxidans]|uniref:ureidoglycolate lyase n=1 Tax=Sulfobacillus thermosulfidooxidans TaxID=28034 RepID=UPI0006B61E35|nr:ureidoglycolate lyase [Sulfobacillus thermosulfidooxidans]
MTSTDEILTIPVKEATEEAVAPYGMLLGEGVHRPGLPIPFYQGSVEEGANLDFVCRGKPVIRTARISRRDTEVLWLEYHTILTQVFIGLGSAPFVMVLGRPEENATVPNLAQVEAFKFPPGHGIMLWQRVWHDFPMAIHHPVTIFTMNSEEVVEALASQPIPADMNRGDVYKVHVKTHTGKHLRVDM